MSIQMTEIEQLYEVADDYQKDTLDELRRKAGITWDCQNVRYGVCWTNMAVASVCERCGAPRPPVEKP